MKFAVVFGISQLFAAVFLLCNPGPTESLSSGVSVSENVMTSFNEIKLEKKQRYVVLVIRNEREIDVEKIGGRVATYADFVKDIQAGGKAECRLGIFDMEHVQCKSLFTMSWCPASAIVRQKVLYSSSYLELKKSLSGISGHVQATDSDEASEAAVLQSNACLHKTIV